ncbi:hypothetical protein [Roseibacillus persicicus]|uniref:hypothetical protein n=1 Tax=Roseibacillus persicicus TaxID=454148 RepID=UPI00167635B4|nr:hypothetical protein [Roseibacillus persicicus]
MLTRFISPKEDTLTASVFGSLLHLPVEVFWQVLKASSSSPPGHPLPNLCGDPLTIEPWPKWSPDGTPNGRFVEPDLFIRFQSFDLIIEAKRWDGEMQNPAQWRAQVTAYGNDYGPDNQDVHYLAVGGLGFSSPQALPDWPEVSFHFLRWASLLQQCQKILSAMEQEECPSSQSRATQRILDDVVDSLNLHGFASVLWFSGFTFPKSPVHSPSSSQLLTSLGAAIHLK